MEEYLKVEGHSSLIKNTKTHAVINTNKNAYLSYKKRLQEAQKQREANLKKQEEHSSEGESYGFSPNNTL